jgi:hypothetical protein
MTNGEQRVLTFGVAAGMVMGLAIGLMIALLPELFAAMVQ